MYAAGHWVRTLSSELAEKNGYKSCARHAEEIDDNYKNSANTEKAG